MTRPAIYVVGAGGIGCAIGYSLLLSGKTVTFVETDAAKIKWGNRNGVHAIGAIDDDFDPLPPQPAQFLQFDDWKPQPFDTVFLCVKCFDNARVLERLPERVELIPVQNGYDPLLEQRDHEIEGIASFVAKCLPGQTVFEITRDGDLHFGPRNGSGARSILDNWFRSNLRPRIVPDIRPIKATKLMYNAAISPLAAGAGVDNGELLADPLARKLFFALIQENYRILTNAGVPLGKVGPFHPKTVSRILRTPMLATVMAKFFVRSLRGTYCSMAGDIEKGRTELDNYTGHLLRLAGDTPAPLNRAVYEQVSKLTKPDRGLLSRLPIQS